MAVTRQSLGEYYRRLSDDELQRLLGSGDLTDLASQVAADELRRRGVEIAAGESAAEQKEAEDDEIPDVDLDPEVAAEDGRDGGNLVLLARYTSPIEAEMARGRLESEGIFASVADAHIVQMLSLMSQALGGVRLLVRQADLARASRVLQSI